MQKIFFLTVLLFSGGMVTAQQINVMTFNIRLNVASDKENAWPNRKERVAAQIRFHDADIVGIQEAKPEQMKDLEKMLPEYKFIGVARDTGEWGEYSAIFYKTKYIELIKSNTFWLSETPSVPGKKGWDAALPRIVTWGEFKMKNNGKSFFVFNTHFDHIGEIARQNSARLILKAVDSLAGKLPVIVTGDFNSNPEKRPYQIIVDKSNPLHLVNSIDISQTPHYGPTGTFNNWGPKEVDDLPIDFIFVKNGFSVLKHATIAESQRGRFTSDHFPVFARLEFPSPRR